MKKKLFVLCSLTFLVSCSKNGHPALITGKWIFVKKVFWNTPNNLIIQKDTMLDHPGEYVDFRTDHQEYACFWEGAANKYDTLDYFVNGNILSTQKGVASGTSDLPTLTANNLTIHTTTIDIYGKGEFWFFYTR